MRLEGGGMMIRLINDIKYSVKFKVEDIAHKLAVKKYKKRYEDYKDDEYNCGNLKFIWGIKSYDDFNSSSSNLYSMNDIDISYDRDKKLYYLGVETAYIFNGKKAECDYFKHLLECFAQYMSDNDYSTTSAYVTYMSDFQPKLSAKTIEELYTNFRIIVTGFCGVYES